MANSSNSSFTISNGIKPGSSAINLPAVGLGCWMGKLGAAEETVQMVKTALKLGYRHFDTAHFYGNEESVGKAIRESGIPREEVLVTTKLADHANVTGEFEKSLKNFGLGYIDFYLMHWPQQMGPSGAVPPGQSPTFVETWHEMEKLLQTGKVKAIGVSNFSIKNLEILLPEVTIIPAINQVEVHLCLPQSELIKYCHEKGIHVTAYSPLGQGYDGKVPFFADPTVTHIAKNHSVEIGQVLLSHAVQRGISVIPKSSKEERLKKNATLITLDDDEMTELNDFHKRPGMHRTLLMRYHNKGSMWGWTYEQLGWNLLPDGQVKE